MADNSLFYLAIRVLVWAKKLIFWVFICLGRDLWGIGVIECRFLFSFVAFLKNLGSLLMILIIPRMEFLSSTFRLIVMVFLTIWQLIRAWTVHLEQDIRITNESTKLLWGDF